MEKNYDEQMREARKAVARNLQERCQVKAIESLQRLQVLASEVDLSSNVHLSRLFVSAAYHIKEWVDMSAEEKTWRDLMLLLGIDESTQDNAETNTNFIINGSYKETTRPEEDELDGEDE